eukprot:204152-Alexandrium_andersonii.AAC.1
MDYGLPRDSAPDRFVGLRIMLGPGERLASGQLESADKRPKWLPAARWRSFPALFGAPPRYYFRKEDKGANAK